jgi:hypothetical protein
MSTAQRAQALAAACENFKHLLGPTSAQDLLELVRLELGSETALDQPMEYPAGSLQAIPPRTIIHILSGNTPHAALQSLVRGLLIGSHNLCKLPSAGLPEAEAFAAALPQSLRERIEFSSTFDDAWPKRADAIIAFGSDETLNHFRHPARQHKLIFIGYGHRISLAIVFDDPDFASIPHAARDVSLFDQQGCLSPHCVYVAQDAEQYAARLAIEMETFQQSMPRSPLTLSESASIAELRESTRFRIGLGQPLRMWESPASNAWTVIHDADPTFTPSILNRVIYVRPLPTDLESAIASAHPFLSTIAIHPNTPGLAARAFSLGATRVCALGSMQSPTWLWRQDGRPTLAPLISWRTWEKEPAP